MKAIFAILSVFFCVTVSLAQTSEKYSGKYADFFRAEELFEKEQFGAAKKIFREFHSTFKDKNDPLYIKARYYEGISALELYNNDAIQLLISFNQEYPENIHKKNIFFKIGQHEYQRKRYEDAIEWMEQINPLDLDSSLRDEYHFKLGYSHFQLEDFTSARDYFFEIKDNSSQYAAPALYYYSHIAYTNKTYQEALIGFETLVDHKSFKADAPYYITQIYHRQEKFEKLIAFSPKKIDSVKSNYLPEMNRLIGNAYFQLERYDEAAFHLKVFNKKAETSREDDYQLGFAYYKSEYYEKAIKMFERVARKKDELGQTALYHAAESYLKLDEQNYARSAFEAAAQIDDNLDIKEDALFNYAILSYELDYNPYNDAKRAFEQFLQEFPNSKRTEDVYGYLVNVYANTNQYSEALKALDEISQKDSKQKTAYQIIAFNMGIDLLEQNKNREAIDALKLVEKHNINTNITGKSYYWRGEAYYRLQEYQQAIRNYRDFIAIPGSIKEGFKELAYYNIAYIYYEQEDYTQAIESFRTFTQLPSNNDKLRKSDAFIRIADAYYTKENPDFDAAVLNYSKAAELNQNNRDRALFYMAKSYGFIFEKRDQKVSTLRDIVNNHRNSKYSIPSIFELGLTLKNSGKLKESTPYFEQIINDYPRNILVKSALIELGDIKYKLKDYPAAESYFNRVLSEFSLNDEQCREATKGLQDVYSASRQQEKIAELAEKYACARITEDDKEELYYETANRLYLDEDYDAAVPEIKKYLAEYPDGRFALQFTSYLGDIFYQRDEKGQALIYYERIIEAPNNAFTEEALIRSSKTYYNDGKYEDALPLYSRLKPLASTPQVVYNTSVGLMRCNFILKFYPNAAAEALEVLDHNLRNENHVLEANYIAGMSLFHQEKYREAKDYLRWTADNTGQVRGTEALHTLGECYFKLDELKEAEDLHKELMSRKPSYDFWIAKSLILQAKVHMKKNDLLQAETTINTVLNNYPNEEDGIIDEATKVKNELMQLKNEPKSIPDVTNPVIDFDDE